MHYAFQEKDSLPGCIKHPKKRDGSRLFVSGVKFITLKGVELHDCGGRLIGHQAKRNTPS